MTRAGWPTSILLRSKAKAPAPLEVSCPSGNSLLDMVVAVGPDAELRVVVEGRRRDVAEPELVQVVGAGGVARRRDGDALAVLLVGSGHDELREEPALG
jgi:hypothetical protein